MLYTKIITEEQCRNKTLLSGKEDKLCEPYLDVSTFLNYFSLDNFTEYCLSYTDDNNCSPCTNKGGNFIMHRRATTGTDRNKRNFSECSRDQMSPIVHALVKNHAKFCFKRNLIFSEIITINLNNEIVIFYSIN